MSATQIITLITAIIGAICGISGAILGIINMFHQLSRNKIRLKIIPSHAIPVGAIANSEINFGIEVINLSEFSVTVTDIGFLHKNKSRSTLCTVDSFDQPGNLPVRLEPRTSYKKYFNSSNIGLIFNEIISAYVTTQCGEFLTGTSGALKQKTKEASA